jgi:diaminohydroxyphosphoribosylaminopyrimidine deaminase / 5-amino-6-(5-phosphoribosylamino)uracil reductase
MKNHEFFIKRCLTLAKEGMGLVSPNPMVGCVIVYKDKIIGEGFHQEYGKAHAEVNAISSTKDKSLLQKSTLYVNLEPCAHFGKTPPCCNLIIEHKIPKVVIGCIDSFSKVSGKGIERMKNAGIKVVVGVLEKESRILNKRFFAFYEKNRPYVILKWAESKDGFIAPNNQNKPFWMTSSASKKIVHKWRAEEDAILVGRITAEKDNPLLTVREVKGRNPIRIVIDKELKLASNLNLFASNTKTIIFNSIKSEEKKSNLFIKISFNNLIINILRFLYKQNIQSIIIEGGRLTLQSFIDANIWNEARIFTTKKELHNGVVSPNIKGKVILKTEIETDELNILTND